MSATKSGNNLQKPIENRVAASGLIVLDLEDFFPDDLKGMDIKPFLWNAQILKEKPYREALKTYDWKQYIDKNVYVHCSIDTLIPHWAWMLAAVYLRANVANMYFGTKKQVVEDIYKQKICKLAIEPYRDKRVIIKGCSSEKVPEVAYFLITEKLHLVVKSLMYGDACSSVPVFKKK